jgi:NADH:ubiquinone oxidoreductase subunit E
MKRKQIVLHDKKVIEYLEKQQNQSKYIEELIIKDINKNKYVTKEEVIELIKKYVNWQKEKNEPIEEDIKNSIKTTLQFDW